MPQKPPAESAKSSTKPPDSPGSAELACSNANNDDKVSSGQILDAILMLKNDFVSRFDGLFNAIQGVQGELKTLAGWMTEAEDRVSTIEYDIASLLTQTTTMTAAMKEIAQKVGDLENWARRSILHLVGLPESAEGGEMCAFLEKWIPDMLGNYNFPGPVLIERAHRPCRINNKHGYQAAVRPRAVVIKFRNYADKVWVMKAVRINGKILVDNQKVMSFPDVSADLHNREKFSTLQRKNWLLSPSSVTE